MKPEAGSACVASLALHSAVYVIYLGHRYLRTQAGTTNHIVEKFVICIYPLNANPILFHQCKSRYAPAAIQRPLVYIGRADNGDLVVHQ